MPRLDVSLAARPDHYHILSGRGFGDIHTYHVQGRGWFSGLVSGVKKLGQQALQGIGNVGRKAIEAIAPVAKEIAPAVKDVGVSIARDALRSGVDQLIEGEDLSKALRATRSSARKGVSDARMQDRKSVV